MSSRTGQSQTTLSQRLKRLSLEQRKEVLARLTDEDAEAIRHDWTIWARETQLPPKVSQNGVPDWVIWMYLAGRGSGKTRAGAEWVRQRVKEGHAPIHLIAPTQADARKVMIEGTSGILSVSWEHDRTLKGEPMGVPVFEPSLMRLVWANGAEAYYFSAEEPDRLRGPQCASMWCLVGETPVSMGDGTNKPISQVQPGEFVLTRRGAAKVLAGGATQRGTETFLLHLMDGRVIEGTGDHPVFVDGIGFVPIRKLRKGMLVCVIGASSGAGEYGIAGDGDTTKRTSDFTERCTKPSTGQSPKDSTFTTRTGTRQTIETTISNFFHSQSILAGILITSNQNIALRGLLVLWKQIDGIVKGSWRASLSALSAAWSTIVALPTLVAFARSNVSIKLVQEDLTASEGSAPFVPSGMSQPSGPNSTAPKNAIITPLNYGRELCPSELLSVQGASRAFPRSAQMPASVVTTAPWLTTLEIASVERSGRLADVYDLTIEGAHEFFADGVLVHNCDEMAAWKQLEDTWDMAMFGFRLGTEPRCLITTTPKPLALVRRLVGDQGVAITRDTTYANRENLAKAFFKQVVSKYEGTRLGRQELRGEILEDVEGALWRRDMIRYEDEVRGKPRLDMSPGNRRIVWTNGSYSPLLRVGVGIDPQAANNENSAETGIIAFGVTLEGYGFVIADRSGKKTPREWATTAVSLYDELEADIIVAEKNQGGDMVAHTIWSVRSNAPVELVHASRAKQARAEPVAALYEKEMIYHLQHFEALEDQQCVEWNTEIATADGPAWARDVHAGDMVLTREGYQRVKWAGCTGYKPTLAIHTDMGLYVNVTANHPVYVFGRGFVRADRLKIGDEVLCLNAESVDSLSSRENAITRLKSATIDQADPVAPASSMSSCGNQSTAQNLPDATSITETKSKETIGSPTSNVSHANSITIGTNRKDGPLSEDGPSCVDKSGLNDNHTLLHAKDVEKATYRKDSEPSSAHQPVVRNSTITAITRMPLTEVWNITVDGQPEFFAGGILVHNCTWEPMTGQPSPDRLDAMVWIVSKLMVAQGELIIPIADEMIYAR